MATKQGAQADTAAGGPGYLDFAIRVTGRSRGGYEVEATGPDGVQTQGALRPFDQTDTERWDLTLTRERNRGNRRDMDEPERETRDIGLRLFEALFADQVRRTYRALVEQAESRSQAVRLKLVFESPGLSSLPWELLFDPEADRFVGTVAPIVRYAIRPPPPVPPAVVGPLRVLGIVASPSDFAAIDVERERRLVEEATRPMVDWQWAPGAQFADIRRALQSGSWHALHYVGHGAHAPETGNGLIVLEDDDGRGQLLPALELGSLLSDQRSLRLVSLINADDGPSGGAFAPAADQLVNGGVAAVVQTRSRLSDNASIEFVRTLYMELSDGRPIDTAILRTRQHLREKTGPAPDWAMLALHTNVADGVLFTTQRGEPAPTPTVAPPFDAVKQTEQAPPFDAAKGTPPGEFSVDQPPGFAQYEAALSQTTIALQDAASGDRSEPAVIVISGPFGAGKTTLAVRAATAMSGFYPGGSVLMGGAGAASDLRIRLVEALAGPLRQFAGDESVLQLQVAELEARYRAAIGGRRLVVVLDDVSDPAVIDAFMPPDPGSALIVTTEHPLEVPGATLVLLGPAEQPPGEEPVEVPGEEPPPAPAPLPSPFSRSGYASDMVAGGAELEDKLQLENEVDALAWVVAARDVQPPLSIGLFGAWGTGKSTFMQLMQKKITTIARHSQRLRNDGEDYPACEHVRQITFNAWHYADANLWASLVTHIFEELAKPEGEVSTEQEYANLINRLETTRALRKDAEQRKDLAALERERRIEQLADVRRDRTETTRDLDRGKVDPALIVRDPATDARAAELGQVIEGTPAAPAQKPTAAAVSAWLATILTDPELVRGAVEVIPDAAARERLQAILGDEDVQASLRNVAENDSSRSSLVADWAKVAGRVVAPGAADAVAPPLDALGAGLTGAYSGALAIREVASDLRTIGGRLAYLLKFAWDALRTNWRLVLICLAIAVVGVGAAALLIANSATIIGWLTGLLSVLGAVATFVRDPVRRLREAVDVAFSAVQIPAKRQIDLLEAEEQTLQREIDQATRAEHDAERDLDDIRQGRRLYRYIEERARATDYKPYLGVIAQVRKDFMELEHLMGLGRFARDKAFEATVAANAARAAALAAGTVPEDDDEGEANDEDSNDEDALPAIDRVILYIDDLDRCPVDRVVQVLEAVHLLLALRLFVVVVGVDPRWLMRSLRNHYSAQLAPTGTALSSWEGDRAYWNSTPENYLEKIFQIPFSLRPMTSDGYRELMAQVLGTPDATDRGTSVGGPPPADAIEHGASIADSKVAASSTGGDESAGVAGDDEAAASDAVEVPADAATTPDQDGSDGGTRDVARTAIGAPMPDDGPGVTAELADTAAPDTVASNAEPAEPTVEPEPVYAPPPPLKITKDEFDFIGRLSPFVPTPRSAKRLANTYRLIRVLPSPKDADVEATANVAHKVPLTLLAILIGFPGQAGDVFRELLDAEDTTWTEFRTRVIDARASANPDAGESAPEGADDAIRDWERLAKALSGLTNGKPPENRPDPLPEALGAWQAWADDVGRFSFEIGRVTTVEAENDRAGDE